MLLAAAAAAAVLPAQASAQTPCATQGTTGTAYAQGVNCRTVKLDGHPRRFLVYVPSTAPPVGERRPVVFMFHGSGGDG
jgi:poly(3-hydroxybutyrate) depolymerase